MRRDDDFYLAGLHDLQRQAEDLAAQLSVAARAAEAEFVAGDSTGAVAVTIDSSGFVTRVRLDRDWLRLVGVAGLGPAVIAAMQAATNARMTAWAGALEAPGTPPDPAKLTTMSTVDLAELGDPSSRQSAYAIRDLLDLVDGVVDRMDRLQEAAESAANRSVMSTNLARTVRISAVGGVVDAIEFDNGWLRSSHHERIADAIQETLVATWRATSEESRSLDESVPGMERMRRLTESPQTLLREIGFIR